ncbi:MFS transporter [Helicobacter saguini]|uniref:MFS transporter n=1 Tax=Helicobacter saguini TaxID=1548018 RepID=A0A347VQV9_9HELI|nr:MFS transporter [Helicobacter saguini]MWV63137.1 MFS transporter [Helicobacter saguini]MWV66193.1 MFS transporter [Helicobacter saguini]MWV68542.1 MFS transporter [Helicobacter saguini]MWV71903.1 MFS transporter [Helicobacter saguini]TLD95917.1 MFS transporter [Helicobacter saguini]
MKDSNKFIESNNIDSKDLSKHATSQQTFLEKIFSVKKDEVKILLTSLSFIFLIFASYAILRPIRDALGLSNGKEELKWLFLGTFIATLCASILAMWLSSVIARKTYITAIFVFFSLNLLGFYIALYFIDSNHKSASFIWLARIFYVWVSVFNVFIISSAWSLLADIFTRERSKRLFGIIAAGASLGSIVGAAAISLLIKHIGTQDFILVSLVILGFCLVLKTLLLKESYALLDSIESKGEFESRFNATIGAKNPFAGFKIIVKSRFLLAFVGFILLLTSISTFLYMEQARVISELFPHDMKGAKEARIAAFANIDLVVQTLSFIIQIFFTAKIAEFLGLRWLLSLLGFAVGLGFVGLFICKEMGIVSLLPIAIVMSIRRVGEYALVKPGREMLFVPLDSDSKYKVKNFLDTVVYRGGDALSAQVESLAMRVSLGFTLLFGAFLSFLWGLLGLFLSKKYDKNNFS